MVKDYATEDENFIFYVGESKVHLMCDIMDSDAQAENIYIINLSNKYDEPYVECLADIPIGTLPFLLKEKSIFFAEKL